MESNTSLTVGLHCLQLSALLCLGVILALILCSGERAELWLAVPPPPSSKKEKGQNASTCQSSVLGPSNAVQETCHDITCKCQRDQETEILSDPFCL